MAALFASLTGLPIVRAMLVIPFTGIWHADVLLDRAIDLTGPQVLTLADTVWTCSVVRAVDFTGARSVRLVGGQGGWRTAVPPLQYASPAGVPTITVLSDLAASVLELPPVLGPLVSPILGPAYVRQGGLASLTLQAILGDSWYMDPTGTIQASPRLPLPAPINFDALDVRGASGIYKIATETLTGWNPGAIFLGPTVSGVVNRVTHIVESGSLRTELMVT